MVDETGTPHRRTLSLFLALGMIATVTGCASGPMSHEIDESNLAAYSDVPRELSMTTLPLYRVEPPDVLLIQSVNAIRLPSAPLGAGDVLTISLGNPEPLAPLDPNLTPVESQYQMELQAQFKLIDGDFTVQPDGTLNLGPIYGSVRVAGLTVEQAQAAIRQHLMTYAHNPKTGAPVGIEDPQVSVTRVDLSGPQPIDGQHLVRPDGTVSLGIYGSVTVAGMTLPEVRRAVESHLSHYLKTPRVSVDVLAYNSKFIYVVTDGGGYGEQVVRLPATGNETVLDAISQIQGLSQVSSKQIWVARPAPAGSHQAQIMDVHWRDITQAGITSTNYQLYPGDRIYIQADPLITLDNFVAKVLAPVERVFGATLLGTRTVNYLSRGGRLGRFGGGIGGGGFF